MGVLLQGLDGLGDVAGVPEPHLAVIPTAGQVVLLVGVEVQVPHQLAMGALNAVDLAGGGDAQVRGGTWEALPPQPLPDPSQRGVRAGAPARWPRL